MQEFIDFTVAYLGAALFDYDAKLVFSLIKQNLIYAVLAGVILTNCQAFGLFSLAKSGTCAANYNGFANSVSARICGLINRASTRKKAYLIFIFIFLIPVIPWIRSCAFFAAYSIGLQPLLPLTLFLNIVRISYSFLFVYFIL